MTQYQHFHTHPTAPAYRLPPGSCDSQFHVFGPADRYPVRPGAAYEMPDATIETALGLHRLLGIERGVIVQATTYGADHQVVLDGLAAAGPSYRGCANAVVLAERDDAYIQKLHDAGVRGVRFNFVKRLVDRLDTGALERIVEKIAPLGWHVVIYFEADDLPELYDFFSAIPTDVVVDHMGRPDVTKDVDGPEFGLFLRFLRENPNVWTKVSCPERLSAEGPPALDGQQHAYRDVVPFARRVVEEFPGRVLWGTDWPHPNLKDHMPDDGLLVDYLPQIAPTADLQRRLLVDNPTRLYWPDGSDEPGRSDEGA